MLRQLFVAALLIKPCGFHFHYEVLFMLLCYILALQKHVSEVHKYKLTFDLPEMEFRRKAKEETYDTVNLSNLFDS